MCAVALRGEESERPELPISPRAPHARSGSSELMVSVAAGSLLVGLGLRRRTLPGLLVAGVGSALLLRGAADEARLPRPLGRAGAQTEPLRVEQSFLIDRPAEELYRAWRDLERLPGILTHLQSVTKLDERRSRWVVEAPRLAGGRIEWQAEIVRDEPGVAIAWQSLPGSQVQNAGEVRFTEAPGHRGTQMRVSLAYRPPAGRLGAAVAKLFGVGARRQVREDLRAFKRRMETGELLTIEGQPTGSCGGLGRLVQSGRTS